jgi:hypothetical protein
LLALLIVLRWQFLVPEININLKSEEKGQPASGINIWIAAGVTANKLFMVSRTRFYMLQTSKYERHIEIHTTTLLNLIILLSVRQDQDAYRGSGSTFLLILRKISKHKIIWPHTQAVGRVGVQKHSTRNHSKAKCHSWWSGVNLGFFELWSQVWTLLVLT